MPTNIIVNELLQRSQWTWLCLSSNSFRILRCSVFSVSKPRVNPLWLGGWAQSWWWCQRLGLWLGDVSSVGHFLKLMSISPSTLCLSHLETWLWQPKCQATGAYVNSLLFCPTGNITSLLLEGLTQSKLQVPNKTSCPNGRHRCVKN